MTIAEMLGQSGVLTLLGMGIVFGFLIIMIFTVTLMGKVVHSCGWDKDVAPQAAPALAFAAPAPAAGAAPLAAPLTGGEGGAIAAAISAAVMEYRKTNH